MATLRDLRNRAKKLGIDYSKSDDKGTLEEMIAAKECEIGDEKPKMEESAAEKEAPAPPAVKREPVRRMPNKPKGLEDAIPAHEPVSEPEADDPPEADGPKEASFSSDLAICESDLQKEFLEQSGKYAFYAEKAARANAKMLTAKMRVEVVEAELFKKIRTELLEGDGPKPTEKMINSEMVTQLSWQAAKRGYFAACEAFDIAKAATTAFQQRKDMLVQLGTMARQEKDQIGLDLHAKAKEMLGKAA